MTLAADRACALVEEVLHDNGTHLVLLTSTAYSFEVRQQVGAVLPPGSTCTGAVWRTPSGQVVSIKRFLDTIPAYEHPFRLEVCNGGVALDEVEVEHVMLWEAAQARTVPILGI
jgi:hypothetical protein